MGKITKVLLMLIYCRQKAKGFSVRKKTLRNFLLRVGNAPVLLENQIVVTTAADYRCIVSTVHQRNNAVIGRSVVGVTLATVIHHAGGPFLRTHITHQHGTVQRFATNSQVQIHDRFQAAKDKKKQEQYKFRIREYIM